MYRLLQTIYMKINSLIVPQYRKRYKKLTSPAVVFYASVCQPRLTLYLLVSSADNLSKQYGPRSGPTKFQAWSGSKLLVTLMVFLNFFSKKVDFEKKSADDKKACKFLSKQRVNNQSFFSLHEVNLLRSIFFQCGSCTVAVKLFWLGMTIGLDSLKFPSVLTNALGAQKNALIETVLFSTHSMCFGWEIRKLTFNYAPFPRGLLDPFLIPCLILAWYLRLI